MSLLGERMERTEGQPRSLSGEVTVRRVEVVGCRGLGWGRMLETVAWDYEQRIVFIFFFMEEGTEGAGGVGEKVGSY